MNQLKIDERLWIYPYKMGSQSAKMLAEELDIWMIKHEGSQWKGNKDRIVLNWGAGTGVFQANVQNATVWNTPEQIDIAVNKVRFFEEMEGRTGPRTPEWTTSRRVAKRWLEDGETVVARTQVEGAKGAGIVLMKNPLDFVNANLYTKKVESTEEYRVYMFDGKAIDGRIKLPEAGMKEDPDNMRYAEDVYKFCPLRGELPEDVVTQAEKCAKRTGLMTGGVDVLYNRFEDRAYILEINTAPYIGGKTAEKYAAAIKAKLAA